MTGKRVQFGSGSNQIEGWTNHEIEVDVRKPLPYADGAVIECLIEHCLEHVTTPEMFRFLCEAHRILIPGGKLWIAMPILDRLDPDAARDIILGHGHLAAYTADSLRHILELSPFETVIYLTERPAIFGHWRVIGEEKDALESFRAVLHK